MHHSFLSISKPLYIIYMDDTFTFQLACLDILKNNICQNWKNNYFSSIRLFKTAGKSLQCLLNYELIWLANAIHITESELPDRFYS